MNQADIKKAAELRREYHRQWRAKNKEKVAKYNQEYWLRKAEQMEREGCEDGNNKRDS